MKEATHTTKVTLHSLNIEKISNNNPNNTNNRINSRTFVNKLHQEE